MVNGMHVYSWPIQAKVAAYGWSNRRTLVAAKPSQSGAKGGQKVPVVHIEKQRSFVEVVEGKSASTGKTEEKLVTFHWKGRNEDEAWLRNCAVGTLKNFSSVSKVNQRLEDRGFFFSSSFMGGNRMLWRFETEIDREGFIMNSFFWADCFKSMDRWSDKFINNARVVWVDCWGVPLSSWSSEFFNCLGQRFGVPLCIEEDTILKRRVDRGRMLMSIPLDKDCPKKIKIFFKGEAKIVSLIEDQNPTSLSWIEEVLEIRNSSKLNLASDGYGRGVEDAPSDLEAHDEGGSEYDSKAEIGSRQDGGKDFQVRKLADNQSLCTGNKKKGMGTQKSTYLTPSSGKKKVDKGKGSWIRKVRAKPVITYDKTARVDLEKRLSEVGGFDFSKSESSTSTESGPPLWKGECSKRCLSNGPQSPSLDQVLLAHSRNLSNGQDRGPTRKDLGSSPTSSPSKKDGDSSGEDEDREDREFENWVLQEEDEGQMVVTQKRKDESEGHTEADPDAEVSSNQDSEDSSIGGSVRDDKEEDSIYPHSGNKVGRIQPLGEYDLAEIGEINLSVVLPTPSPNVKNRNSRGAASKSHGMRTRRDIRREPELADSRADKNQPEGRRKTEAAVRRSWNIEAEIAKVIDIGKTVGFDITEREQEVAEQLFRRECEDEDRLKHQ
ncbi:hypothetical protein Q3G72_003857 [Acer saccharum]|nr:hypothetical protein Q3G72_003857 [Acer saccharum]